MTDTAVPCVEQLMERKSQLQGLIVKTDPQDQDFGILSQKLSAVVEDLRLYSEKHPHSDDGTEAAISTSEWLDDDDDGRVPPDTIIVADPCWTMSHDRSEEDIEGLVGELTNECLIRPGCTICAITVPATRVDDGIRAMMSCGFRFLVTMVRILPQPRRERVLESGWLLVQHDQVLFGVSEGVPDFKEPADGYINSINGMGPDALRELMAKWAPQAELVTVES